MDAVIASVVVFEEVVDVVGREVGVVGMIVVAMMVVDVDCDCDDKRDVVMGLEMVVAVDVSSVDSEKIVVIVNVEGIDDEVCDGVVGVV